MSGKPVAILLIALCQLLALSVWFSASAVAPAMSRAFPLSDLQVSLFTSAVQAGFVTGTLASAALGLADRIDPRRLFSIAALVAAIANALILVLEPGSAAVYALRFITGACMAGTYPVGMKMVASWARNDLGLLVAILVGALTLGSSSPHLFNVFGGVDWRFTIAATSVSALVAAILIFAVRLGPAMARARTVAARHALTAFRDPALRLANFGYLGHMWELYAMWAWLGVFLAASFHLDAGGFDPATLAGWVAFLAIGVGGLAGCLAAGLLADRWGRTRTTALAMAVSGACAATIGLGFGGAPWLVAAIAIVWGASVIADSAQFSASVTELSDPERVGTMLTVQTCAGFALTLATIHLMPLLIDTLGWRYAFAPLAIGPAWGVIAMLRLRQRPEALRLAGGNR